MISSSHGTDEKQEHHSKTLPPSLSILERQPASMANRIPEKMPHVTSSAAIAPGCLSAQRGVRRETQGETECWVRNKGRKRIQRHGICGNIPKPEASLRQQWNHSWPHLRCCNGRRVIITAWHSFFPVTPLHLPWQQTHADTVQGLWDDRWGFSHGNGWDI